MAAKEPARAISRAMVMGSSCAVGDFRLAPMLDQDHWFFATSQRRGVGLDWLKTAQCNSESGDTRTLFLIE
jgi:hypothetical protein